MRSPARSWTSNFPPNGSIPRLRSLSSVLSRWAIWSFSSSIKLAHDSRREEASQFHPHPSLPRGTCCSLVATGQWEGQGGGLLALLHRLQQVGLDERVEVAVQDGRDVAHLHVGPVVLDELVGLEDIGADLTAEADLLLLADEGVELLLLLLLCQLVEARPQHLHRPHLVFQLGALVLALHDDAGGDMRDADGGLHFVDVLPAGPA